MAISRSRVVRVFGSTMRFEANVALVAFDAGAAAVRLNTALSPVTLVTSIGAGDKRKRLSICLALVPEKAKN